MTTAEAALEYRQRGLSVIPISPATKKPPVRFTWKRFQRTPATENEIRRWWTRWPDANVGIITGAVSGIIALDGDGVDGVRHLTSLGTTAFTPLVRTPRGGLHQIFKHPGGRISSRAGGPSEPGRSRRRRIRGRAAEPPRRRHGLEVAHDVR